MDSFVAFLKENWAVIAPAIWQFAFAAAVAFGAGVWLTFVLVRERVANLKSRLERRDEEIAQLKIIREKPSTNNPDAITQHGIAVGHVVGAVPQAKGTMLFGKLHGGRDFDQDGPFTYRDRQYIMESHVWNTEVKFGDTYSVVYDTVTAKLAD